MTAVMRPFSGDTPDAMAKAIARGRATMPTSYKYAGCDIPGNLMGG